MASAALELSARAALEAADAFLNENVDLEGLVTWEREYEEEGSVSSSSLSFAAPAGAHTYPPTNPAGGGVDAALESESSETRQRRRRRERRRESRRESRHHAHPSHPPRRHGYRGDDLGVPPPPPSSQPPYGGEGEDFSGEGAAAAAAAAAPPTVLDLGSLLGVGHERGALLGEVLAAALELPDPVALSLAALRALSTRASVAEDSATTLKAQAAAGEGALRESEARRLAATSQVEFLTMRLVAMEGELSNQRALVQRGGEGVGSSSAAAEATITRLQAALVEKEEALAAAAEGFPAREDHATDEELVLLSEEVGRLRAIVEEQGVALEEASRRSPAGADVAPPPPPPPPPSSDDGGSLEVARLKAQLLALEESAEGYKERAERWEREAKKAATLQSNAEMEAMAAKRRVMAGEEATEAAQRALLTANNALAEAREAAKASGEGERAKGAECDSLRAALQEAHRQTAALKAQCSELQHECTRIEQQLQHTMQGVQRQAVQQQPQQQQQQQQQQAFRAQPAQPMEGGYMGVAPHPHTHQHPPASPPRTQRFNPPPTPLQAPGSPYGAAAEARTAAARGAAAQRSSNSGDLFGSYEGVESAPVNKRRTSFLPPPPAPLQSQEQLPPPMVQYHQQQYQQQQQQQYPVQPPLPPPAVQSAQAQAQSQAQAQPPPPPLNAAAQQRARRARLLAEAAAEEGMGGGGVNGGVSAQPPPLPPQYPQHPPPPPPLHHAMAAQQAAGREAESALLLSSAAAKRAEEESRARELALPSKHSMDTFASAREASAPYATGAAVANLSVLVAEKEGELLTANRRKLELEGELQRLSGTAGGARTIRERQRAVVAGEELEKVQGQLASLRRWLKQNCPQ